MNTDAVPIIIYQLTSATHLPKCPLKESLPPWVSNKLFSYTHFFIPKASRFLRDLTPFEQEHRGSGPHHNLSWALRLILQEALQATLPFLDQWETDLQIKLTLS